MQEDFLLTIEEEQQIKSSNDNNENSVTSQQTASQSDIIGTQNNLDQDDAGTTERNPEAPIVQEESSRDTIGFEHITLGSSLPAECQNEIILATGTDLEFWQHPFSVAPTQSQTIPPSSSQQQTPWPRHNIFLPAPPPDPKHYYHQASLQQPPVASALEARHRHHHVSINPQLPPPPSNAPDSAHSLTYLSHIPFGSGNGYFLHHLPLYSPFEVSLASLSRHFIPYLTHGHLEITPSLMNRICPADLCHKPCPFDNIYVYDEAVKAWRFGCKMLRLCEVMHRYPWKAPPPLPLPCYVRNGVGVDGREMNAGMLRRRIYRYSPHTGPRPPMEVRGGLRPGEEGHERECGWLHGVVRNCRHLEKGRRENGTMTCRYVMVGGECVFGHDFEEEREGAYERLVGHKEEARRDRALVGRVWRNEMGKWMGLDRGSMVREEGEEFPRGLNSH